jgi:hypothetical protein
MRGGNRYIILNAALYLLFTSFPTQCVAVVPRLEEALQRILDNQVGRYIRNTLVKVMLKLAS